MFAVIILLVGILMLIKPYIFVEISWSARHGLDDQGKKSLSHGFQFLGVMIIIGSLIWMFSH